MRPIRRLPAAAVAASLAATPASAFEAYPLHPVHESLTRAALTCLARYNGARPTDCRAEAAAVKASSGLRLFRSFTPEEKASTWSDDPVREIAPLTLVRFAASLRGGCARAAKAAGDDYTLDRAGLMCASHFGPLQFLHAMRSSPDEPRDATMAKVSAWAAFTYGLAAGRIALDRPYCAVFAAETPAIADDLAPEGCAERRLYGRRLGDWTAATLFTLRCGHAWAARRCNPLDAAETTVVARRAAQGAMLHVIQDSYSQSHALRGSHDRPFEARIDCAAVAGFHFYGGEAVKTHGLADQPPTLSPDCGPLAPVDDAVTASATAIWMVRRDAPVAAFSAYFRDRVLGKVLTT